MPKTPKKHFDEDIARARALLAHATAMPSVTDVERLARDDVLRSAWMFAAGAMDAYFSDAYADLVAAVFIAKNRESTVKLPSSVTSIEMPVAVVLTPYKARQNWRWRVGARRMMDRENVLSTGKIQTLFNKFFRAGHRLYGDVIEAWILAPGATKRLLGITAGNYRALTGKPKGEALKQAQARLKKRLDRTIAQRRHDCIHNCDRPKVKPQAIDAKSVREADAADDASFLRSPEAASTRSDDLPVLLTIDEAAALLRTSPGSVYQRVARLQLTKTDGLVRDGRRVLFHRDRLLQFLERGGRR